MEEGVNIPGPGVSIPVDSSNLPDGWTRNPKHPSVRGEAPFVHERSGKMSWKNPNQAKIKAFLKEMQEEKEKQQAKEEFTVTVPSSFQAPTAGNNKYVSSANKSMVKKLRLMLQAGAPLHGK